MVLAAAIAASIALLPAIGTSPPASVGLGGAVEITPCSMSALLGGSVESLRSVLQETPDDIPQEARDVVVEVVPRQAPAECDRSGGEDRTATRHVEIDHVGAHELGFRLLCPCRQVGELLFVDKDKTRAMAFRACQDLRVRW